jgi:hypothetical protein
MQEYQEDFNEMINQFIKYGQNNNNTDIKSEYLKLVKSFHPDVNKKRGFRLCGGRKKVQFPQVKQDCRPKAVAVPKAAGHSLDSLYAVVL